MTRGKQPPGWGAIVGFVCLAYGAAWVLLAPSIRDGADLADPVGSPGAFLGTVAMMFAPAAAAFLVSVVFQRRRGRALVGELGLAGFFTRRAWRFAGMGMAAAVMLVVGSWGVGLLFGWVELDPERSLAKELIVRVTGEEPPMQMGMLAVLQLVNIPIGLGITAVAAAGEEIGWRGWLLARLLPLGEGWALVVSGLIWGFWHAPAILLGLNYGYHDVLGIVMMAVACIGLGVMIGWLRLVSGSLLPCVLAHAALNVFATYQSVLFPPFDQRLVGPLALTGWMIMGLLIAVGVVRAVRVRTRRDVPTELL